MIRNLCIHIYSIITFVFYNHKMIHFKMKVSWYLILKSIDAATHKSINLTHNKSNSRALGKDVAIKNVVHDDDDLNKKTNCIYINIRKQENRKE